MKLDRFLEWVEAFGWCFIVATATLVILEYLASR